MEDFHAANSKMLADDLAEAMNAVMVAAREAADRAPRMDWPAVPQNVYPTSNPSQRRERWGAQAKHGKVKRGRRGGR